MANDQSIFNLKQQFQIGFLAQFTLPSYIGLVLHKRRFTIIFINFILFFTVCSTNIFHLEAALSRILSYKFCTKIEAYLFSNINKYEIYSFSGRKALLHKPIVQY